MPFGTLRSALDATHGPIPGRPDPTSPDAVALLFQRTRQQKGWSILRLSMRASVPYSVTYRACIEGNIRIDSALKLGHALGLTLFTSPEPRRG